jgi:hypothetical protein
MKRILFGFVVSIAVAVVVSGCTGGTDDADRADRVPATATVTYNGEPVEGATVTFSPQTSGNPPAYGTTDESGQVELTTYDHGDGAVPGKYNVAISKTDRPAAGPEMSEEEMEEEMADAETSAAPPADLLPAKYKDAASSGLTAEVTEGGDNSFTFALTDQ